MKFENFSVKRTQCSNTISCHLGHLAALGRIIFVCVANPDCGIWYVASLVNLYFPFLFRCRLYTILIYLNVIFLCLQDCFPVLIEELIWNDLVLCVLSSSLWHGQLRYSQKFDATLKHWTKLYSNLILRNDVGPNAYKVEMKNSGCLHRVWLHQFRLRFFRNRTNLDWDHIVQSISKLGHDVFL